MAVDVFGFIHSQELLNVHLQESMCTFSQRQEEKLDKVYGGDWDSRFEGRKLYVSVVFVHGGWRNDWCKFGAKRLVLSSWTTAID